MHADDRELANHLFATATAMQEDATGAAIAGQSPRIDAAQLIDLGQRLQAAARDAAVIAEAAVIVVRRSTGPDGNQLESSR